MIPAALAVLLACGASGASAAPSKSAASVSPEALSDTAVDWLRLYSLSPYHETWTMTAEVKDLKKGIPRVVKALEEHGGTPVVPLANSAGSASEGTQQLVYRLSAQDAPAALKALGKVAKTAPPVIRPAGEKLPAAEIKAKRHALAKEKEDNAAALARMPAVSGLVNAALGHLDAAEAVAERGQGQVTLNLTLVERRKEKKK